MVDFTVEVVPIRAGTCSRPGVIPIHYCELRNQAGELMAENDDGSDQNCRIRHALTAGTYRFNVQGYSGSTGEFTAQVDLQ